MKTFATTLMLAVALSLTAAASEPAKDNHKKDTHSAEKKGTHTDSHDKKDASKKDSGHEQPKKSH